MQTGYSKTIVIMHRAPSAISALLFENDRHPCTEHRVLSQRC